MRATNVPEDLAGAILTIDLDAVVANYRLLRERAATETAAVVKADAYGLGAARVAPRLWGAGCRIFFVAHPAEGIQLRAILPTEAEIHILNGLLPDTAAYVAHRLIPALGSLVEIERWRAAGGGHACDIHVDTGMLRLGLAPAELARLAAEPGCLDGLDVRFVMSHFASADDDATPQNAAQAEAFRRTREILPMGLTSFANSAGIFLGPEYRGDVVRAGFSLYGGSPTPWTQNPMRQTVKLMGRVLAVRDAEPGDTVSYGATYKVEKPMRIATVGVGYADGYPRSLSGRGHGHIDGVRLDVLGRVTMDLIMLDASAVPADNCRPGAWVELIGPNVPLDAVAEAAGTIGYEILTSLGPRYHRRYLPDENGG
jgi:alanine racemase